MALNNCLLYSVLAHLCQCVLLDIVCYGVGISITIFAIKVCLFEENSIVYSIDYYISNYLASKLIITS